MSQEAASPTVRLATIEDVPEIFAMIKELAIFEEMLDRVDATEQSLKDTLTFAPSPSNPNPPTRTAKTFVLTVPEGPNGSEQVAGMALFFNNYSTWLATPGVYLEDLFVRPDFRRRGFATVLLQSLAVEAAKISNGKGRLEWSCLRWNENALKFYAWLGGKRQDDWIGIRVEGQGLQAMASLKARV